MTGGWSLVGWSPWWGEPVLGEVGHGGLVLVGHHSG